jgi:hypothetical protein
MEYRVDLMGFPSVGAWVTYGLGSENSNLPAYVVIYDRRGSPSADLPTGTPGSCRPLPGAVFRSAGDRFSIFPRLRST